MAERIKAPTWKVSFDNNKRGFESLSFRYTQEYLKLYSKFRINFTPIYNMQRILHNGSALVFQTKGASSILAIRFLFKNKI